MASVTGLSVAVSPLVLGLSSPAAANPLGDDLVISEVYGGGGNSGATFTHDFVELYNPTDAAIDVDGLSVQYRSGTNSGAGVTPLTGEVAPGGYYLVQQAQGSGGSTPLPSPDATGTQAMSGGSGIVALVEGTEPVTLSPTAPTGGSLVDLVGYGSATVSEGDVDAPGLTNTTSASRDADGTDTDVNGADFTAGAVAPVSSGGEPEPPPPVGDVTVAEIQGTGTQSPLVGREVTTSGVVTALYDGTYNGFFLQTAGTGGATDATPGASDAVFVYGGPDFDGAGLALGDSVEVTGQVGEFGGATQVTVTAAGIAPVSPALAPVTPLAAAYPTTTADREAHEGELLAPTDDFTVTNVFSTNRYAEIGLATGDRPLIQPTEVADAGSPEADAVAADNAARGVVLDDGASIDFLPFNGGDNQDVPLPWLSQQNPVRVGAAAELVAPVVLDYRNNTWKLQPQEQVTDEGRDVATFENTRPENAEPADVGGDLSIGTFNVLNYFNTTGAQFESNGGRCTYYLDRDDDPVSVNSCTPDGPRGAAELGDFRRQQAKIVEAINTMDTDIVSLEEIENSVKLLKETDRDDAVKALVSALNTDAGTRRWAYAASPAAADLPPLAEQDVIRNAFIYDPTTVRPVGASEVLVGSAAFASAREPLAQAFKPAGAGRADVFAVIVNHFKSKGSGTPDPDGQGNANDERVAQAAALADFAKEFSVDRGTRKVFLTGDFNSYSEEDPIQLLEGEGFSKLESDTPGEYSYSFSGLSGSLDHVLASPAARRMVTGVDIWETNANESVAFQYSRRNYNARQLFSPDVFAASDHNPEVVGLSTSPSNATEVQLLTTNDFHGRLQADGTIAGAAVLSGAVKQLRSENPNTVFAAAGDLIGASTFASFIAEDKPTIDSLNEAGLDVSAVGNHEFDQGYDDLTGRVLAPESAENPNGGAEWEYLGANVRFKDDGSPALDGTWIQDFGGTEIGFVGAVTEDLPSLVSPTGIEQLEITDVVDETNAAAADLKAEGADVVVLLVHEGAPGTDCTTFDDDPSSKWGSIVTGVNDDVDAIVSGHTHLAYDCSLPVEGWADRDVTERPVVSAGQYGTNLNRIRFEVDSFTGQLLDVEQDLLPLAGNYPADPAVTKIVADAVAEAKVLGAEQLGDITGTFSRAKLADGTTDNRGGESTLGNLVAEIQQWATEADNRGAAQVAFMNPGGLRADLTGLIEQGSPRPVTYEQAATVQPFANTLVNQQMTGAQIKAALEQQWQPDGASRPFLKLGISEGFTYTYDPEAARGEHVLDMRLDGEPVDLATSYSVTVNSFLAGGGDDFAAFREAAATGSPQDTGVTDLQATVDFLEEFATEQPLAVDYSQRAVGTQLSAAEVAPGDTLTLDLSSLSMTGRGDVTDDEVTVLLDGTELATAPVVTQPQTALPGYDEVGTATAEVTLPDAVEAGTAELTVVGEETGTEVVVPVQVTGDGGEPGDPATPTIAVDHQPRPVIAGETRARLFVDVTAEGAEASGQVRVKVQGRTARLLDLDETGSVVTRLGRFGQPGAKTVRVVYLGDEDVARGVVEHTIRVRR
ncbi:ExeM/NucH family extracellular endonuclease [Nocardioides sp. AX2bis]|uniref:ExeM/NucH family extracellular endonuclease n=1 Tax=Nocardioides sp. AX2bis TaxID=2653157 RepID=UPI0012F29BB5|nr:ExeM/NucH family extracellular endonuclease [Nocardioides sp. AX2bis]VXB41511.1 5'-nucleotidase [Nocardioides sp. AX2bis]